MYWQTSTIHQAVTRKTAARSPGSSLQPDTNTQDHSRSATTLLLRHVPRDAGKGYLHCLSPVGSHGVPVNRAHSRPQGIHEIHLRLHHNGRTTSTTGRAADSPDGRPTDHRWLSQDRSGDLSGSPFRRATGPWRHRHLRTMHYRSSPDRSAETPCSARHSTAAARKLSSAQVRLRFWNFKVFTDFLGKKVVDLSVAWNSRGLSSSPVHVDTVVTTLTKELNTMTFKMANQIDPLHEMEASGSRITILLRSVSSASARLDSKVS